MDIIVYNNSWMTFNAMLALLAVLLGYFLLMARARVLHIVFGIFWLVFLPNTAYLYTDIIHLINQWPQVTLMEKPIILLQHMVLQIVGVITFILGYRPFELWLEKNKKLKERKIQAILAFNLLITFGMVLGRVERVNSWEIVSDPFNVLVSSLSVFTSFSSLGLLLLLWVVVNCSYFLFHKPVLALMVKSYRSVAKGISRFSIDK